MLGLLANHKGTGFYKSLKEALHKYGYLFNSGESSKSKYSKTYWSDVSDKGGITIFGHNYDVEGMAGMVPVVLGDLLRKRLMNNRDSKNTNKE